jgi:hypothetical protein
MPCRKSNLLENKCARAIRAMSNAVSSNLLSLPVPDVLLSGFGRVEPPALLALGAG